MNRCKRTGGQPPNYVRRRDDVVRGIYTETREKREREERSRERDTSTQLPDQAGQVLLLSRLYIDVMNKFV